MADDGVNLAQDVGVSLDYTEASLTAVEALLDLLSKQALSDDNRDFVVQHIGCYLLEVGRRAHGGYYQWWDLRNAPVLVAGGAECHIGLMTWDKVRGRLGGDLSDNVPFFYAGFAERARLREPGESVTVV